MPTKTIFLEWTAAGWVSDWSEHESADFVREIMGTTRIETPFGPQVEPARILAALSAKNPGSDIRLRTGGQ